MRHPPRPESAHHPIPTESRVQAPVEKRVLPPAAKCVRVPHKRTSLLARHVRAGRASRSIALTSLVLLSACGGGSSATGDSPATPPAATNDPANPYSTANQNGATTPSGANTAPNGTSVPRPPQSAPMPRPPNVTNAATAGAFGATFAWKEIPLHMALQPDGRVVTYGSDTSGAQTALEYYAIWEPLLGPVADSVTLFDNPTKTDLFCSAATLLDDGRLLITGGDATIDYWRNYSIADTSFFNFRDNTLTRTTQMTYKRWYPTLVALPDNQRLVVGGRTTYLNAGIEGNEDKVASIPEIYTPGKGWATLDGAANMELFGVDYSGSSYLSTSSWWYPRTFVAPNGKVFGFSYTGRMYWIDTTGNGSITTVPGRMAEGGYSFPSVMYRPGKILSVRNNLVVQTIDLTGATPVVQDTAPIDAARHHAGATIMADGRVFVHGGSSGDNDGLNEQLRPQIWDPATGKWTEGAAAREARLYHSASLLMPDATILTGGGGAPGPHNNLNAEIYYPSYLFRKDGSGNFAERPTIAGVPATATYGTVITSTISSTTPITRVAFARLGSATHTLDTDQRYVEPTFAQNGSTVAINVPTDRNVLIPGYYMVFVFDGDGVPSVAPVVQIVG